MSFISIRQDVWTATSRRERRALQLCLENLELGEPIVCTDGDTLWCVFVDSRFTLRDLSVLGCLCNALKDFSVVTKENTDNKIRRDIAGYASRNAVFPDDIDFEGVRERRKKILEQNRVSVVMAGDRLPVNFSLVEER